MKTETLFHYFFFWIAGVSTLMPWFSALSLTTYFDKRIEKSIDIEYPFCFFFGSFVAFLLYKRVSGLLSLKKQMFGAPCVLTLLFGMLIVVAELMEQSSLKKWLFLILIAAQGFFSALYQTKMIGYVMTFTFKEISAYNSGSSLAGIFTAVVSIANQLIFDSEKDSKTAESSRKALLYQSLVYTFFTFFVLVIVLLTFAKWTLKNMKEKTEETFSKCSKANISMSQSSSEGQPSTSVVKEDAPGLFAVLREVSDFFMHMICLLATTMSLFPTMSISMGLPNHGFTIAPTIIILIFNSTEMLGKFVYTHAPIKKASVVFALNIARIIPVLFAMYVFSSPETQQKYTHRYEITLPFILLTAFSTGYLMTSLHSISSLRVAPLKKDALGYWMSFGFLFGLTYGSFAVILSFKKD